jgi:acetyl esterase/lipase
MKRTLALPALLATVATLAVGRRHRRMSGVAPELRSPLLYIPMTLRNDRSLRFGRRLMAKAPATAVAAGVQMRTEHIPTRDAGVDIPLFVYEPDVHSPGSGALLWIHGGGLVMGTPEQGHDRCSRFAAELGIVVVSVGYRLAPEHPFPAALDDCFAALSWIHEHAEALKIDGAKIAVGGESAGGGLAACLAQLAVDSAGPAICFQLLQYPMLDDRTALRADHDALVWTNGSNKFAWRAYLGHQLTDDETRPHAVAARRTDLTGLPPAWIGIGDIDLFHDECSSYAQRLRAAGVDCAFYEVPGMYHGADRHVPKAPSTVAFLDAMTSALGRALAEPSPTATSSDQEDQP